MLITVFLRERIKHSKLIRMELIGTQIQNICGEDLKKHHLHQNFLMLWKNF